jgi:hypothetical protein
VSKPSVRDPLLGHNRTERPRELLERVGRDYDDVAEDLETGAVEIRHAEMMPQ